VFYVCHGYPVRFLSKDGPATRRLAAGDPARYQPLYEELMQSNHSLNAEVVRRSEQSFAGGSLAEGDVKVLGERLAEKLAMPENRAELEDLPATLYRLASDEKK
jgi:hypothetical protein